MPIYYVENEFGCGLQSYANIQQAIAEERKSEGQYFKGVRKATKDDIEWVRGMGGYVPKGA